VEHVTIDSRGRMTVSRATLARAGIEPGDELRVRVVGPGRIELITARAALRQSAGRLTGAAHAHARIREMRAEWGDPVGN
jgi:bifunctional DNA-binding transcriptional regulator/antitoxin component of YhaV-PrlF toxin-antitoxin module